MQRASSSERRFCWPLTPASATTLLRPVWVSAARPSTGPSNASCSANLPAARSEQPRPGASRKLAGKEEALLVATACSKPPAGRARWTLELLAGELVRLTEHTSISRETVRRRLTENDLKPWRRTCGAFRRSTPNTSPAWRTCSTSMPKRNRLELTRLEPTRYHKISHNPVLL